MITCRTLGNKGRLGNQLYQIASLNGIAKRLNTTVGFPRWKYDKYFKNKLPRSHRNFKINYEKHFHYSDDWFMDNMDYEGWMQSEKYFESREAVKKLFEFEPVFKSLIRAKYKFEKETICVSIRRGDFVGNPNYELLPAKYYIGALLKFDLSKYHVVFFSDDINYCKTHFQCLDATFVEADPIEQLCLMTMCDNHIISQSTFSWWGAYLSESKRVIRPAYNFTESYKAKGNDDKDYWPEQWEVFDHKDYKIDLSDVTFLIPVQYDHKDRLENFALCVKSLINDFNCEIIVGERVLHDEMFPFKNKVNYTSSTFHRTKILNDLAKRATTKKIVVYDADVMLPPMALYMASKSVADMIYPYDGRFARVPRKWYHELLKYLDCGILSRYTFDGMRDYDLKSLGGAILFNKESYLSGGGQNENFISYAPEDVEIYERFSRLGFKIERIKGVIYHIDHYIGLDSYINHPDYGKNEVELNKIRSMSDINLKEYVSNTLSK